MLRHQSYSGDSWLSTIMEGINDTNNVGWHITSNVNFALKLVFLSTVECTLEVHCTQTKEPYLSWWKYCLQYCRMVLVYLKNRITEFYLDHFGWSYITWICKIWHPCTLCDWGINSTQDQMSSWFVFQESKLFLCHHTYLAMCLLENVTDCHYNITKPIQAVSDHCFVFSVLTFLQLCDSS